MSTKSLPDIRTSYTPIERALLSAYLRYPDPAPHELEGIDISETVDPDEWDESVQGIAPLPNLHGIDSLMLENAVARICLEPVAPELPQWASVRDGKVTLGRTRRRRTALRSHRPRRPKYLFTINWADSGPGFSWPEKYFVARIPGYEVCIVTGSADCPDATATPTSRSGGISAACRTSTRPANASATGGRRRRAGDRTGGPTCSALERWTRRRPNDGRTKCGDVTTQMTMRRRTRW